MMGYYDDGQFRSMKRGKGSGSGSRSGLKWIAVAVVAALIGSGSTLVAVPMMIQNGFLPIPAVSDTNMTSSSLKPTEQVNLSVNDSIVQAVKRATPSVVGVVNWQSAQSLGAPGSSLQEVGIGSGVIFDAHGYIITNNHVVEGASKVEVVLNNKKHVYATVVGTDPYTDLAVLKIPSSYVQSKDVAQFGDSSMLQAGEPAIAIGNPAGLDFADSVTEGVISATQRTMPVQDEQTGQVLGDETVIQTDAAINPGNSGGPLCNILGQVIGINSSKIVAQGFEGMGFAIPINEVRTIAREILATGHALHPALGIVGESLTSIPPEYQPNVPVNYGVWVYQVTSASAKAAGLEHGDVIISLNGKKVTGISDLRTQLLQSYSPGQTVTLGIYRGQQKLMIQVKLGDLPTNTASSSSSGSGSSSGSSGSGGSTIPDPFSGGGSGGLPFP